MSIVALFLSLSAGPGASVQDGAYAIRTGERFRVVCTFGDERIAEEALVTAEAVWPLAARIYGAGEADGGPFEIYLYRDADTYRRVEERVTGGRFRDHLAFTSWRSRQAFLALQPESSDAALAATGLPALTRRLVAHEAAHLVCYHAQSNYRGHPEWLAEGLAEEGCLARTQG